MRTVVLDYYLDQARELFGEPRKAVDQEKLLNRFKDQNYAGMMGAIQTSLELKVPLRIGWQRGPMPKQYAPIRVEGPDLSEIRQTSTPRPYTVYLYKQVIGLMSFEMTVMGLAHLLTHLVLYHKQSPLVDDPAGVDVTAMLLGFHEFYTKQSAHVYIQEYGAGGMSSYARPDFPGGLTYEEALYVAPKLQR